MNTLEAALAFIWYKAHSSWKGGTICDNKGRRGGVGIEPESTYIATMTMHNGSITGNESTIDGGGVCIVNSHASFTMTGGEIRGNKAADQGGGVKVNDPDTFKVSGTAKITDNVVGENLSKDSNGYFTGGTKNNVSLFLEVNIKGIGALNSGASIGVTKLDKDENPVAGTVTSGFGANHSNVNPSARFHSDSDSYAVCLETSGTATEVALAEIHSVIYHNGDATHTDGPYLNSAETKALDIDSAGFTAPTDMIFDHWNTAADDTGKDYMPGDTVFAANSAASAPLDLYAQWRGTVSYSGAGGVLQTVAVSGYDPVPAESWGTSGATTTYAVTRSMELTSRVTVSGTVNLVLLDGKTLKASRGITVA